jgi:arginine N-succinyltransferase
MVVIRPVTMSDLEPLLQLAEQAGVGLTTLPKDRQLLSKRIAKSQRSMENIPAAPSGESYMFVMQDVDSEKIVGASGIVSKVGGFEPFYAYRLETQTIDSKLLGVHKDIQILHLVREHDGPAEVGSLFLSPDYRKKDFGRFLQLVRFLFIAEHPDAFERTVVSELRGIIDDNGHSAFWDAVGKHFFQIDFPRADYLSVVNKKFIADLMPAYPIYVSMLPPQAQAVIGKVHQSSKPALKNLETEGFKFNGMVDIFDAGPCVSCLRDDIRTVRQSRLGVVESAPDSAIDAANSPTYMIGARANNFRAVIAPVEIISSDAIRLTGSCIAALNISAGDSVRFSPLRPPAEDKEKDNSRASG